MCVQCVYLLTNFVIFSEAVVSSSYFKLDKFTITPIVSVGWSCKVNTLILTFKSYHVIYSDDFEKWLYTIYSYNIK